jgi:hypothetical protein
MIVRGDDVGNNVDTDVPRNPPIHASAKYDDDKDGDRNPLRRDALNHKGTRKHMMTLMMIAKISRMCV